MTKAFWPTLVCLLSLLAPVAFDLRAEPGVIVKPPLEGAELQAQKLLLQKLRTTPNLLARPPLRAQRCSDSNTVIYYYMYEPKNFDSHKKYPLTLSLHHEGVEKIFADLFIESPPGNAYGIGRFISDETQDSHPSFLIVPWGNRRHWENGSWKEVTPQTKSATANMQTVIELMDGLKKHANVDSKRMYVTGQSMGGFGTWDILLRRPDLFAAAIPIGGGGDPLGVFKIRDTPIWAFHGNADSLIPVERTRIMIRNLIRTGGSPIYWEYDKADHLGAAERAYCEPGLIDWLFKQSKP